MMIILRKRSEKTKEKAILDMAETACKVGGWRSSRGLHTRFTGDRPVRVKPRRIWRNGIDIATKLERLSRGEPTEIGSRRSRGR